MASKLNIQEIESTTGTLKVAGNVKLDMSGSTDFMDLPAGTSDQRGTPVEGAIRWNYDYDSLEVYNGTAWKQFNKPYDGDDIVKAGLVLHLDAANKDSYPGTGTNWYDLTSNINNGTISGPTYADIDSTKAFEFSLNNHIISGNVGTLNAPFTVEYFGKFKSASQVDYEYFGSVGNTGTNAMISVSRTGTRSPGDNNGPAGLLYVYPGFGGTILYDVDLANTDWHHIVVRALPSSPFLEVYRNGIKASLHPSTNQSPSGAINTNGIFRIGQWQGGTWDLNGFIGKHAIYDRALSQTEIEQNFNALRDRFGV